MDSNEQLKGEREASIPDGFTVSIVYNKSGFQLIPKKDL